VVPASLLIGLVAIASRVAQFPLERALSDPLDQADAHPLLGFVSNLGILAWAGAAGVCLVAALVLRSSTEPEHVEARRFFRASGVLTMLLVLDDTFQVHETIVPNLLGRGQTFILIGYVLVVAAYVWRFRASLLAAEWIVFALSGACFAISIGIDLLPVAVSLLPGDAAIDTEASAYEFVSHLVEDGGKFVGIVLWLAFYAGAAAATLVPRPIPSGPR
jgi:hypothetical protein